MGKPNSNNNNNNNNRNTGKKEINQEKDVKQIKHAFKKSKPLKRNELIAQKEKAKLFHKYKKMMRKEAKINTQQNENKTVREKSQDNRVDNRKNEHAKMRHNKNKDDDKKYRTVNQRAQTLFEQKQLEKQKEQEEREKKLAEKRDAIKKYKLAKKEKFKKLCNKTKSGQILMSKQMDLILNKIQKNSSK